LYEGNKSLSAVRSRSGFCKITKEKLQEIFANCTEVAGHNIVNFDLPALKLFGIIDYKIGYPGQSSTLNGKDVIVTDTLVWSQLLNPDRFGGHSLANLSKNNDVSKTNHTDFSQYSQEMEEYMVMDVKSNWHVYYDLTEEKGNWDYSKPYAQELKLVDLNLKQSLFGFKFNTELAKENLEVFDKELQKALDAVNPVLPPKPLNKGEQKEFTPPVNQIKKDLTFSSYLVKFADRVGATLDSENLTITFQDKVYKLPHHEPIVTELPATIDDLDHLKGYLLSLGWKPTEWKIRDLTKDSKKVSLTPDKIEATVQRYVQSTLTGPYKKYRLSLLETTEKKITDFLLNKALKEKRCLVPVSPMLRVGTEKVICKNLETLGQVADFVKDVTNYLTYKHRRNSIAGGTEAEDGTPTTGYLSLVREDNRISTPAITIGANTYRYRHIGVANIPRVSSLEGHRMRALFGCGENYVQLGADFSSLENRIQGSYIFDYPGGEELAETLIAEKPNDLHAFPVSTELFTESGFKPISSLTYEDKVLQWDSVHDKYSFVTPSYILIRNNNKEDLMYTFSSLKNDFKMTTTCKHRILLTHKTSGEILDVLAEDLAATLSLYKDYNIPTFNYVEVSVSDLTYFVTENSEEEVGCVTVPSTYILVRQNNYSFVSGNCLDTKTEILTKKGWMLFKDLTKDVKVAQWDKDTQHMSYTYPTDIISSDHKGKMISVEGDRISMSMTLNHRCVVYDPVEKVYKEILAKDLTTSSGIIPTYGLLNGNDIYKEYVAKGLIDLFNNFKKDFPNTYNRVIRKNSGIILQSEDKTIIENIQIGLLHCRCNSIIVEKQLKIKSFVDKTPVYQILVPFENPFMLGNQLSHTVIQEIDYNDKVYCVTVPTSYIVCKRNGKIFITGNSANAGRSKNLTAQ
jgi:hypothetical protein